jgi:hypothetical protein
MASVTQRIPNFLGGVSKQPDDKKFPGQLRECLNAYPDPTFGLAKRPGFKHLQTLSSTPNAFANAKWFYIRRDNSETYIGNINGSTINVWNAATGVAATVTYENSAANYLTGTKDNYDILTVQDTTLVVNNTVTVTTQAATTVYPKRKATIRVYNAAYGAEYKVTINSSTYNFTTKNAEPTTNSDTTTNKVLNIDTILSTLQSGINGLSISGLTVTKLKGTLELSCTADFTIDASGGVGGDDIKAYQDSVNNIGELPGETMNGRIVTVNNTVGREDTYYAEFKADNGVSGKGYWEETIKPGISIGLNPSTMPHELLNTALNTFVFRPLQKDVSNAARSFWEPRLVGDDETNEHPSFVGQKIQKAFFHNNRLGFLTEDNVSMSQAGEYFNFYHVTALSSVPNDPIDISCSSIRPAVLKSVVPTAQGLVLFTESQQFMLYADQGVLTPGTTTIRAISNYEIDPLIHPVDVGTNIMFVSKIPGYMRVFAMQTRGQQESPDVIDIGRIISEWIPSTIDNLIASSQNSFIAMSGRTTPFVYFYRTYGSAEKMLMQSWFKWQLPGNVQFCTVDADNFWAVTYQSGQYSLIRNNLNQTPDSQILVTNQGNPVQICIDMYRNPSSVVYDSGTQTTKCYLPYSDVTALTPVLIVAGTVQNNSVVESGFTVTPTRGTDGTGTYFAVQGKNLTSQAAQIYIGYKYNFDVELPQIYYQVSEGTSDYTATLTVGRLKFSVGLSSNIGFKLKRKGAAEWYDIQSVQDADYYLANDVPLTESNIFTLPIHQRNDNFNIRVFSDSPFPVALTSMMWEGNYSPRYYRRR